MIGDSPSISVQDLAQEIFKDVYDRKLCRSRKCGHAFVFVSLSHTHMLVCLCRHEAIVIACVYAATRALGIPRTLKGVKLHAFQSQSCLQAISFLDVFVQLNCNRIQSNQIDLFVELWLRNAVCYAP